MKNISRINSKIKCRTVLVNKHKTSVSIENEFWNEFKKISKNKKISLNKLVSQIDKLRTAPLSSAIRLFVLNNLKKTKYRSN